MAVFQKSTAMNSFFKSAFKNWCVYVREKEAYRFVNVNTHFLTLYLYICVNVHVDVCMRCVYSHVYV